MNNKLGIICIFKMEVFNSKNEITFSTGEFCNTVLDNGLLKLYDYGLTTMTTFVNVGTSFDAVDISQTGLINRLYSSSNVFNNQSNPYYSWWPIFRGYKRVVQFDIGTCTGEFAEIGLSRLNNSDYFNRQRIKNALNQDVLVKVKSDEGLRITCDLRIYPDPNTKIYSEVYKLNLNGNTSGDITFSNGTTTRTLTYAQLTTANTCKSELETLCGINKLANYVLFNTNYFILSHPLNTESLNLSISSNTMAGGLGPPILSTEQVFSNTIAESSFEFYDGIIDQTVTKTLNSFWVTSVSGMNNLNMRLSAISGTQYNGWGYTSTDDLTTIAFKNLYPKIIDSLGNLKESTFVQTTKAPIIGDYSFIKRCYFAPGKLGTGDQIISGVTLGFGTVNIPIMSIIKLNEPITVPQVEEFEFHLSFSWGRYEIT